MPIVQTPVEFFKEDENYYYISQPKTMPGETELKEALSPTPRTRRSGGRSSAGAPVSPGCRRRTSKTSCRPRGPAASGSRRSRRPGFRTRACGGRPSSWRTSTGTACADIVAPPARLGDGKLHVWIGDGKGSFTPWPVSLHRGRKADERSRSTTAASPSGDIDGDGKQDVVSASHGAGLVSALRRRQGRLRASSERAFPRKTSRRRRSSFSTPTATASSTSSPRATRRRSRRAVGVDKTQVRVYPFLGREQGWEFKKDGLVGGFYSNSLNAWDYDGDGQKDVLTGSHYTGALTLLWKNAGRRHVLRRSSSTRSSPTRTTSRRRPAPSARSARRPSPTRTRCRRTCPRPLRATGHHDLRVRERDSGPGTGSGGRRNAKALPLRAGHGRSGRRRARRRRLRGQRGPQAPGPLPAGRRQLRRGRGGRGAATRLARPDACGWPTSTATADWTSCSSKTVASADPTRPGGWDVYLNRQVTTCCRWA